MVSGVVYLLCGEARRARVYGFLALVSMFTCRRFWSGKIGVVADSASWEIAELLAADKRLAVELFRVGRVPLKYRDSDARFMGMIVKATLPERVPYDRIINLDADTAIHGELTPLWPTHDEESVFVQHPFEAMTDSGRMAHRIGRLRWTFGRLGPQAVAAQIPAVAGSICALNRGSLFARDLGAAVERNPDHKNIMETEMNVLYWRYPHRVLGNEWCRDRGPPMNDLPARISHFGNARHGRRLEFLHPFAEAWNGNVAKIREWMPEFDWKDMAKKCAETNISLEGVGQ